MLMILFEYSIDMSDEMAYFLWKSAATTLYICCDYSYSVLYLE